VAREKSRELRQVAKHDLAVAVDEFLAMTKRKRGKKLAGSAGADGGVVLQRDDFLQLGSVAGRP
jgi:hypothetical protein